MRFYKIAIIATLAGVFLLASCTYKPSAFIVEGVFTQDDSLVLATCSKGQDPSKGYDVAGSVAIKASSSQQSIAIPIPEEIVGLELLIRNNKNNSIVLNSIELQGIAKISGADLSQVFSWQGAVIFQQDSTNHTLKCLIPENMGGEMLSVGISINKFIQKKQTCIEYTLIWIFALFIVLLVIIQILQTKKQSLLPVAIIIYLSTFPLIVSIGNWALILYAISALLTFIFSNNRKYKLPTPYYFIFALYVLILIGLTYSIDFGRGIKELKSSLPFVALPLIFGFFSLSISSVNNILRAFVRSMSVFCLLFLLHFLFLEPYSNTRIIEIISTSKTLSSTLYFYPLLPHPSFMSIILLMVIPVTFHLRFGNVDKKMRWIEMITCIILVSTAIMLSGARIGLIILPILFGLSILFFLRVKPYFKYISASIGLVLVIAFYLKISDTNSRFNDPHRNDLRSTAIAAIQERPILGWGTGSMQYLLYSQEVAHKAGLQEPIAQHNHFHNQYLDEIVQFGFIGSLLFFGLLIYLVYLAIKKHDFLLMAYLAIYLSFMLVESPFATAKGIQPMIFWMCFLIATQQARLNGKTTSDESVAKADTLAKQNT